MSLCVPCNRTFGSDTALKAHKKSSPKHVPFNCRACNRAFSTQAGLSSHQEHSTAHQNPRRDSVTTSITPVSSTQHVPLPFSAPSNVPSATDNGQRSGHTATENSSHTNPPFDLDYIPLEDTLQALTISDVNTTTTLPKVGRARIPKREEETRISFTFPELHQRIAEAVSPAITSTWFNHEEKARPENGQNHITCVMGKFTCVNNECRKNGWSSKVVAIKIRGYARSGYNATVYNQHCKACGWLGRFTLDEESYVERIAYRLKRWAGMRVERLPFNRIKTKEHESIHCEGCKVGDCPWVESSGSET